MKKVRYVGIAAVLLTALVFSPWPAGGQQQKRASPHESIYTRVGGKLISVTYGRPNAKDRKIWGGLVPYGKSGPAGADEATLLLTETPLVFGETTIPAGAHTLYLVPMENGPTKLAFSKQIGQWGIQKDGKVDESGEFARVDMKKETVDKPLDQFTITIGLKDKADKASPAVIRFAWADTAFSSEFTAKK